MLVACAGRAGPAAQASWEIEDAPPEVAAVARIWGAEAADGDASWTQPELLERVVAAHPGALVAGAAVEAAQAHRAQARYWLEPELEGRVIRTLDGGSEVEAALVVSVPLAGGALAHTRAETLELQRVQWAHTVALRAALREAHWLMARLAHARARQQQLEVLSERSGTYAELARQRRAAAVADPLDVSLVLADAARDRRAALQAEDEAVHIEAALRALVGLEPGRGTIEVSALTRQRMVEFGDLVADAQASGGPWMQAHLAARQAEGALLAARLEFAPTLKIGPALVSSEEGTAFGAAIGVGIPLLGGQVAGVRGARAERDGAVAALGAEARRTTALVEAFAGRLRSIEAQQEDLEGPAREAASQAFALAQARYEAGRLDVLLLLSAHRAHEELEAEILELRLAHIEARLELEELVGRPLGFEHVSEEGR